MLILKYISFLVLNFVVLFLSNSTLADQTDPRLDFFFRQLKVSSNYEKALDIEIRIWEIWMDHSNPWAKISMNSGVEALNNYKFEKALRHFKLLTEKEPEFAEGWNKRATVLYLMGRYNESERDVIQTLKLEPRHFGALSGLGLIRIALKNWSGAISALESALKFNPHMSEVIKNLKYAKKKLKESMI